MSCGVFAFSFGPWEHYRACARPGRIRTSAQAIVRLNCVNGQEYAGHLMADAKVALLADSVSESVR